MHRRLELAVPSSLLLERPLGSVREARRDALQPAARKPIGAHDPFRRRKRGAAGSLIELVFGLTIQFTGFAASFCFLCLLAACTRHLVGLRQPFLPNPL